MSVILTAGKRAVKPKSAKPKKKRSPQAPVFNPTPPLSSQRTTVWFWELDGVATTVMLSKDRNEVWCNGVVVETIDGFAEEDTESGGSIDFTIYVEETDIEHKARIKRVTSDTGHNAMEYQLFVDGYLIQEHTGELQTDVAGDTYDEGVYYEEGYSPYLPDNLPQDSDIPPDPPAYEEAVAQCGYTEDGAYAGDGNAYEGTEGDAYEGYEGYEGSEDYQGHDKVTYEQEYGDYNGGYTEEQENQSKKYK